MPRARLQPQRALFHRFVAAKKILNNPPTINKTRKKIVNAVSEPSGVTKQPIPAPMLKIPTSNEIHQKRTGFRSKQ